MGSGVLSAFEQGVHRKPAYRAAMMLFASVAALTTIAAPFSQAVAAQRAQSVRIVTPKPVSPMLLLVSLRKQRVRAFDVTGELNSSRISSGRSGFDTPTGVFSILEKKEYHESNIYDSAPMPFMQRLTWSGIALHAGVVPGYPASHGCIRLPASFATSLFRITNVGTRVIVTQDETDPIPFDHKNLFKPLPAEVPAPPELQAANEPTQVASNDKASGALSEIPQFLGVTAAMAAAAATGDNHAFAEVGKPRSRAEAAQMIIDRGNALKAAIKSAEETKITASEAAKRAVKDAQDIEPQLAAARKILDPLKASIAATDRKMNDAVAAFQRFMSGAPQPPPAGKSGSKAVQPANLEEREADLEDAILDLRLESDAARAELAKQELEFAVLLGNAATIEAARDKALSDVQDAASTLRSTQAELIEANKDAVRRNKPLSIFISLKSERIYLRQGFDPLIDAPITVKSDGRRLGTHVFTAMRYDTRNPDQFDWRLVSAHLPAGAIDDADQGSGKKKKKSRETLLPHTEDNSFEMASDALDAITVPQDVIDMIAELATPGLSVIVSDKDLTASENGPGTEFVQLTR